mmetsp:Transcript_2502/g.5943  ORF Transcript_2502/g.5943 Transcript_2502/m.5943 type:complete len:2797 (-) Transcript_2502:151-8541(-)
MSTSTSNAATMDDFQEVSMSQHLFEQVSCWTNPNSTADQKVDKAKRLKQYVQEVDGYLNISSDNPCEGQWPVLEWNEHFRKAYTILLWVRPVVGELQSKDDQDGETIIDRTDDSHTHPRVLYRFATHPGDSAAQGVCVTLGEWRCIDVDTSTANCPEPSTKRRVMTHLTAYSLPSVVPGSMEEANEDMMGSSIVMAPLELWDNEWSLIGITHVFPYLKRPHWTLCVNGRVCGSGELTYPILDRTPVMNFNTLLKDICHGGVEYIEDQKSDAQKTASELQNQIFPKHKLEFHLASYCLACDSFGPTIQAILAQAGPSCSIMNGGHIPQLPPLANWTKGSSLDGPNVGIPLVVHGQAITVQQLSASCMLWGSAIDARILGRQSKNRGQRTACRMQFRRGTTHSAPRVGLIQPTPPNPNGPRSVTEVGSDEEPVSLTLLGICTIHHNLSDYLLKSPDATNVDTQMFNCTKHFSLLLEGQALDCQLILPFFLALPPPGTAMELQFEILTNSLRHLFDLYTNEAELACLLIDLLAASVHSGGGRWEEQLLQNGSLHVMACALRQSLVRAEYLQVDQFATYSDFVKAHAQNSKMKTIMSSMPVSPTKIPIGIAKSMSNLIASCCGPPANFLEDLDPADQIQRTSDLALTALFGIGLDWELWGRDLEAATVILEAVASRYGGSCVTAGYIMRSQVSVQFFLDTLKYPLQSKRANMNTTEADRKALERIGNACAKLLQAMLLSSLSNQRIISQGEHDISACMGALSDCPLGSVGAHVIFTALMGVLRWCEVVPEIENMPRSRTVDDDHKCEVASRLGRNLIMSQFHDVVAAMLLSRTVFCGERTMSLEQSNLPLSWDLHWRYALIIFAWVSTIAGPEGVIASKSLGSLLLASSLAGSLKGALTDAEKDLVTNLLMPPPAMALTVAAMSRRSEWSYTDLLTDRLQIMMPLLPGLVVSIVSHPSDTVKDETLLDIEPKSLDVLADLITAVGGSFYRVFGGMTHQAVGGSRNKKQSRLVDSTAVQAAKNYIPHLITVAVILENHILLRDDSEDENVNILKVPAMVQRQADDGSWVEVSSTMHDGILSEGGVQVPEGENTLEYLKACQKSVLTAVSELMSNSMRSGGGEASTMLWRSALMTLEESRSYSADSGDSKERKALDKAAHRVLCSLCAMVLIKCLKRDYQWEVWSSSLSSAVSRLCMLIEERELLLTPMGKEKIYTKDQVLLLCALLNILTYGRDTTGWCQLILPSPPLEASMQGKNPEAELRDRGDSAPAAAKLLLPVLQPALRSILGSIGVQKSEVQINLPKPSKPKANSNGKHVSVYEVENVVKLLDHTVSELKETLTAAIVGMSFANSRDIGLHALATLRRSIGNYKNTNDDYGLEVCNTLFGSVAEEMRVRYEGERRRRDTALFDAYDEDEDQVRANAAAGSQTVEKMMLGGAIAKIKGTIEEVDFLSSEERRRTEDDFVLFDGSVGASKESHYHPRMKWKHYEGLGDALEESLPKLSEKKEDVEKDMPMEPVLTAMSPFLDSWDEFAAVEAAESELVKLFDFSLDSAGGMNREDEGEMQYRLQATETAADSMSTFIELAAAEKSRLAEVTTSFLPNHRSSASSYAERFCWARYLEIAQSDMMNEVWERGVADGNRDVRSRLVTIPCNPQFRRHIPKYLDHSTDARDSSAAGQGNDEFQEIDEFTKTLLNSGHLEIVDITKKEVNEEEQPELFFESGNLDDDFGERPMEAPTAPSDKGDAHSDTTSTADATATTDSSATNEEEQVPFDKSKIGSSHYNITASAFASPPDNSSSTLSLMHSAAAGLIEKHLENCLHVKAEGSRKCSLLLTATHLILEYDIDSDGLFEGEMMAVKEEAERQRMSEDPKKGDPNAEERIQQQLERRQREAASLRPKSIRWNLSELSHVYLRRYRLRDSSIEMFFIPSGGTSFGGYGLFSPSTSLFIDFGPGYEGVTRRDDAAFAVMRRAPPQAIKQWPDRSAQFLHEQLSRLTMGWVEGRITNFDYLLHLNMLAGRSYNDICQYPVMPWVLANYSSEEIPDLCDPANFRDMRKPMGALNPDRLQDFIDRFNTFADPSIPPFMYGSHYSTMAGVVLHFLVRMHPYASLHRQLQGGNFDVADRLFSSVPRTWEMCTGTSAAEVKELTPEWYCNPGFLKNGNKFKLGTSQDGEVLGDVVLPPWAKGSPETFIEVMRNALESDICSQMLPDWIDLIFGRKQQGPEAIAAHNVFFYLTYYGSVDVAAIEDEGLRQATELQIAHFGQCPMQLFVRPHVRRIQNYNKRVSFYQITSAYTHGANRQDGEDEKDNSDKGMNQVFGQPLYLPFFSAPMSHWVHLDAPPPGPHAPLISVRLAGTDRCLAVDALGVFHCFRWAWKAQPATEVPALSGSGGFPMDNGCFIAQRELPRFRTLPRLVHKSREGEPPAVAISKTLFAGRSVLLVLSDGDGRGGLAMQLVDPAKGSVRGEAVVQSIHSAQITCVATDPIGTAAGHGGVGGELAIVGSYDGRASIWRFMSSHYLPLRPRVQMSGHGGAAIHAVGLSAAINIAATCSSNRLCLHSVGNGNLIRTIQPPQNVLDLPAETQGSTHFANCPALAISVHGFVVTVCETKLKSPTSKMASRSIITLHLFSLEGVSLGTKPLESWRGRPHKMYCTPDGTAVLVCSGRGVTIHRLSAVTPLEFIDEWHITEQEELSKNLSQAFDIDLGPSLNRPVVAAAATSNGALRLHALSGISSYSDRHKKLGLAQGVGNVLAMPAKRLKNVVGRGLGIGSKVVGVGKDVGKEVQNDIKEKGVGGFLGNMFGKK